MSPGGEVLALPCCTPSFAGKRVCCPSQGSFSFDLWSQLLGLFGLKYGLGQIQGLWVSQ